MEAALDLQSRAVSEPILCVHFAAGGSEHTIWYGDAAAPADVDGWGAGRVSIAWRELPGPLLRGQLVLGRDVACDCFLLLGGDAREDQVMLRSQGVPRSHAALLARMPQRPLLATFARRGDLPPATVRRLHRLLLSADTGRSLVSP